MIFAGTYRIHASKINFINVDSEHDTLEIHMDSGDIITLRDLEVEIYPFVTQYVHYMTKHGIPGGDLVQPVPN
jgi:hypothetical protein